MKTYRHKGGCLLLIILILISNNFVFAADYPTTWDLSKLFKDEAAFTLAADTINDDLLPKLVQYKGKLSDAQTIGACMKDYLELSILADKLYVYSSMIQDTDTSNSTYQEYVSVAMDAYANLEEASAFIKPELLKLSDAQLTSLANNELSIYRSYFTLLIENRPHVLTEEAENILAYSTEFTEMPKEIYDQLTITDSHFDLFTNPIQKTAEYNPEIDTLFFYSENLEDRISAYDNYMKMYSTHANTLANIYIAEVQKNIFLSKSRGYDSTLEYATSDIITVAEYKNLIDASRQNAGLLQKLNEIKRKSYGYEALHSSDVHLPYAASYYVETTYAESVDTVLEALAPLGSDYTSQLDQFLQSGTVDVLPAEFKTSSQYTWGTYGSPTYVLLNFNNDFSSQSTLAHELGHAMNQILTNAQQSYFDTNVGPYPAEATSTLNELLLLDLKKSQSEDPEMKIFYLEQEITLYTETFFSQAILADFEMRVYDLAESGEPLSLDVLNELWLKTSKEYYGESLILDDSYQYQWMQIPHLYQTFYVYSYAMSLAASTAIKDHLVNEGDSYQKLYLDYLSSGSTEKPAAQMLKLGINMDDNAFYQPLFTHYEALLNEMDTTLESLDFYTKHPVLKELYSTEQILKIYENYYANANASGTDVAASTALSTEQSAENAKSQEELTKWKILAFSAIAFCLILFLLMNRRITKNKRKLKALNMNQNTLQSRIQTFEHQSSDPFYEQASERSLEDEDETE